MLQAKRHPFGVRVHFAQQGSGPGANIGIRVLEQPRQEQPVQTSPERRAELGFAVGAGVHANNRRSRARSTSGSLFFSFRARADACSRVKRSGSQSASATLSVETIQSLRSAKIGRA